MQAAKNYTQILYSANIQDTIEFFMVTMVPTERDIVIRSYEDLLPRGSDMLSPCFTLPDWMVPLVQVSHFLHFFRKEMQLPENLMKDAYKSLMDSHLDGALDNIIVIRRIPKVTSTTATDTSTTNNKYT